MIRTIIIIDNKDKIKEDLIIYKNKINILSILSQETYKYYSYYKNFHIPLIISNTIMTLINLKFSEINYFKISNIIFGFSSIIISPLLHNKLYNRIETFRIQENKYITLEKEIDKLLINNSYTVDDLKNIIEQYNIIFSTIKYSYPLSLINKIKNQFINNKILPLLMVEL